MKDSNFESRRFFFDLKKKIREAWGNRRLRKALIRHMLPIAFALVLLLLSLLPVISFQTVEGRSEFHSLMYWNTANFWGTEDARGAYELLQICGEGNPYYSFYRAVVILCIVDAVCIVIGVVSLLVFSIVAIYLLLTEEKTKRSRFVGKLFRVIVGNRWAILIPCIISAIPFLFPRLFAYYSTELRSYATIARFLLVDPLFLLLAFLVLIVVVLFRTRKKEQRSRYNIYLPPEEREGARENEKDRDMREWEAAIRADAESDSCFDADREKED